MRKLLKSNPPEVFAFVAVFYRARSPIPVEYMMHLEAGFVFGKDGKAKKDIANVIPGVGRIITSSRGDTSATPRKKKVRSLRSIDLGVWGAAFPATEGIMLSQRISHSGHAIRVPTLMSLEVKGLSNRHLDMKVSSFAVSVYGPIGEPYVPCRNI